MGRTNEFTENVVDKLYNIEGHGWGVHTLTEEYEIKYYMGNICEIKLMKKYPGTDHMNTVKSIIFPMNRGSKRVSLQDFSADVKDLLKYIEQ